MSAQHNAEHQDARATIDDSDALERVPEVALTYTYDEPGDHVEVTYLFPADELIPLAGDEVEAGDLKPGDRLVLEGALLGTVKDVRPMPVGGRAPPLLGGRPVAPAELEAAGYRRVIATVKHTVNVVVDVRYGGDAITATPDHPFWVANRRQWVPAAELRTGDLLQSLNGTTVAVDSVSPPHHGRFTVYNLEVDDQHSYHAGKTPVLVHNGSVCGRKIATTGYRVYKLVRNKIGGAAETIYYGITRQKLVDRASQHRRGGKVFNRIEEVFPELTRDANGNFVGMTRAEALALEKNLIKMGRWFDSPVINKVPWIFQHGVSIR
jgi:hypothetical protein